MKKLFCGVLLLFATTGLQAYERYTIQPGEKKEGATYYTDDQKQAVFLTLAERRTIEDILKKRIWSDKDYNKEINDKLIMQYTGACSECGTCSADAELFKKTLNDFKGKKIDILFSQLNLRREI